MATSKGTTKKAAGPKAKAGTTSAKRPAKKVANATATPLKEEWRTAGATLAKLFIKSGDAEGAKVGAALASKLADGTATNADLLRLRDAANAEAARLRQANEGEASKLFSEGNYMVRRAERATRAGR